MAPPRTAVPAPRLRHQVQGAASADHEQCRPPLPHPGPGWRLISPQGSIPRLAIAGLLVGRSPRHPRSRWSRPMPADVCSMIARMPRYAPAASGTSSAPGFDSGDRTKWQLPAHVGIVRYQFKREKRIAAGDHPERLRSEAARAHLCAAAPIPASSGKVTRHRLNPGGDRQANHALWRIVFTRMGSDPATRAYVERRTKEGKSKAEIIRCLKRYVAREVYPHLRSRLTPNTRGRPDPIFGCREPAGL